MSDADLVIRAFREMNQSDLQGGKITFAGADYPCTIGVFEERNVLLEGVSLKLLGDIQLNREDFADNITFELGNNVLVTPNRGRSRACQVFTVKDSGPFIELTLHDPNEAA